MKSGRDFHPQITLASSSGRQKEERDPAIVIKPVAGRAGEYLAYCRSAFLNANYAVYFKEICCIQHMSFYVV